MIPDSIPPQLAVAVSLKRCVPFFGAGVSRQAGILDWDSLISIIKGILREKAALERRKKAMSDFLNTANHLDIVERFKKDVSVDEYHSFLIQYFSLNIPPSTAHLEIAKIDAPFFITTNFDRLFEIAFSRVRGYLPAVCTRYDQVVVAAKDDKPYLIKIHGCINDISTIVFSQSDYSYALHKNGALFECVRAHMDINTFLYVGYSMSDPDFNHLVSQSMCITGGNRRDDFAIMKGMNHYRKDLLSNRGIKVIDLDEFDNLPKYLVSINRNNRAGDAPVIDVPEDTLCGLTKKLNERARSLAMKNSGILRNIRGKVKAIPRQIRIHIPGGGSCQLEASIFGNTLNIPEDLPKILSLKTKHFVIMGEPGIGKTLLMNMICTKMLDDTGAYLPVYMKLKDYASSKMNLREYIKRIIGDIADEGGLIGFSDDLLDRMFSGTKLVLFIDGYDEIDPKERGHFLRSIADFRAVNSQSMMFITTRNLDNLNYFGDFAQIYLMPLSNDEVMHFYNINQGVLGGIIDRNLLNEAVSKFENIASNPLLLTCMLLSLDRVVGDKNSCSIIESTISILIESNSQKRNKRAPINEHLLWLASDMAFRLWMMEEKSYYVQEKWLLCLSGAIRDAKLKYSSADIFDKLINEIGLLHRYSENNITFSVNVFFEYLVARYANTNKVSVSMIQNHIEHPHWENIIRYMFMMLDEVAQEGVLKVMWQKNQAATLRIIKECKCAIRFLSVTLQQENEEDVVTIVKTFNHTQNEMNLIDSLEPLFSRASRNGYILWHAIEMLERLIYFTKNPRVKELSTTILNRFWEESDAYGVKLDLVKIDSGIFKIGSDGDNFVSGDELPRHEIYLDEFHIGKTVVTNREYKAMVPSYVPDPECDDPDMPVTNITWFEALLYAKWAMGRKSGTLPTEAQWEVACRAGCMDDYPWGNDRDSSLANVNRSVGKISKTCQYKPNKFGLFDMIGNIFEWCCDWYDKKYYSVSEYKNPTGPSTGRWRVMRGGCWAREWESARCSYRVRQIPNTRDILVGFRVCRNNDDGKDVVGCVK